MPTLQSQQQQQGDVWIHDCPRLESVSPSQTKHTHKNLVKKKENTEQTKEWPTRFGSNLKKKMLFSFLSFSHHHALVSSFLTKSTKEKIRIKMKRKRKSVLYLHIDIETGPTTTTSIRHT
jgi:hypothetical protein